MHEETILNRDHYDRISDAWPFIFGDSFHWGLFLAPEDALPTATTNLIDRMAGMAGDLRDARISHVGCGIGGPAIHLARNYQCHVTGISVSGVGVDRANKKAAEAKVSSHVQFFVRDAMNMLFEDEAFDVAWVMESSHLMPDKARLVSECCRVLKPGGCVVLCDLMFQRYPSAREILDRRDELLALEKAFGKARLDTLSHYPYLFAETGLEDIDTEDLSVLVRPTIEHLEKNIHTHCEHLSQLFSVQQTDAFLVSLEILKDLYATAGWGYGIIHGTKRAIES